HTLSPDYSCTYFFFSLDGYPPQLHSFPTRRSSDLSRDIRSESDCCFHKSYLAFKYSRCHCGEYLSLYRYIHCLYDTTIIRWESEYDDVNFPLSTSNVFR